MVGDDMPTTRDDRAGAWQSHDSVEHWMTFDGERAGLLRWAGSLLPFPDDAPIRVLDLGGGHGPFTAQILDAYASSSVCLQDVSAPMLRAAGDRLACFAGRFDCNRSDLCDPRWTATLHGPFHAVVSALVIHTLEPATVPRLYADVVDLLHPGGCFLNLDLILQPPESSVVAKVYQRAGPAGFSHHDGDDVDPPPPTLEEHLRFLRDAGFGEVDCVWKQRREALLCGVRTPLVAP
jgi:tRNA (cmo5U34)-methyltransferase